MRIKPKEVLIDVPTAIIMKDDDEAACFASNINTVLHGKVKIKTDYVGSLEAGEIFIFYLQRNDEFSELREEFLNMIESEEMSKPQPLNGRESSLLANIAQSPGSNHKNILNSLSGFALEIANEMINIQNNKPSKSKESKEFKAAQGFIDWANGLKK